MDIVKTIADELEVRQGQVEAAVELLDDGCTVPFIARYRKERTGALNDEQLRTLYDRLTFLRNLEERKGTVISTIEEQGKMTPELMKAIEDAMTMVALEDIYRPYKPKRRTRATIAKEAGLEPLANLIYMQINKRSIMDEAADFVSEEKGVADANAAIAGACDIIAENISDDADYRTYIRELTEKKGILNSAAKDAEAKSVYENYYDFHEPVAKMSGYKTLAVNRGEKEKILTVTIEAPRDEILEYLDKKIVGKEDADTAQLLKNAAEDAYDRLIAPSIER